MHMKIIFVRDDQCLFSYVCAVHVCVGVRWHTVSTYCTVYIMDILCILAVVSHWFTVYQMDVF